MNEKKKKKTNSMKKKTNSMKEENERLLKVNEQLRLKLGGTFTEENPPGYTPSHVSPSAPPQPSTPPRLSMDNTEEGCSTK
jgi:regulator of replication initiation timing